MALPANRPIKGERDLMGLDLRTELGVYSVHLKSARPAGPHFLATAATLLAGRLVSLLWRFPSRHKILSDYRAKPLGCLLLLLLLCCLLLLLRHSSPPTIEGSQSGQSYSHFFFFFFAAFFLVFLVFLPHLPQDISCRSSFLNHLVLSFQHLCLLEIFFVRQSPSCTSFRRRDTTMLAHFRTCIGGLYINVF